MSRRSTVSRVALLASMLGSTAVLAQKAPALAPADYVAIQQLVMRYPYALDTGEDQGRAYANLFTDDGEFVSPVGTVSGHARLAEFAYGHRPGQGPLLVRNFGTNFLVQPAGDGRATGKVYGVVIDFGEHGEASSIVTGGHFEDVYVRTANGWRFRRREFVPSSGGQK